MILTSSDHVLGTDPCFSHQGTRAGRNCMLDCDYFEPSKPRVEGMITLGLTDHPDQVPGWRNPFREFYIWILTI